VYSEIYVMNVDGTAQKRLTNIATGDACGWVMDSDGSKMKCIAEHGLHPARSPNDRQFAFASNRDGAFQFTP
jgi:Tol biopolymer transport system component